MREARRASSVTAVAAGGSRRPRGGHRKQGSGALAGKRREAVLIDLALQGGGAHGAFTWGVLDRLLEESWLHLDGISGTSAGAMNAAVLVHGFVQDGASGARGGSETATATAGARSGEEIVHHLDRAAVVLDHVLQELAIEVDALRGIERLDLVVREHPRHRHVVP